MPIEILDLNINSYLKNFSNLFIDREKEKKYKFSNKQ